VSEVETDGAPKTGRFEPLFLQAVEKVSGQKPPVWRGPFKVVTVPAGTTLTGVVDAIKGGPEFNRRSKTERRLLVSWIFGSEGARQVREADLNRPVDGTVRLALKEGDLKYSHLVKRRYTLYLIRTAQCGSRPAPTRKESESGSCEAHASAPERAK
jgi:hypothetical protein